MDPANNKSIVEIQAETASKKKLKGKEREVSGDAESAEDLDMNDMDVDMGSEAEEAHQSAKFRPMTGSGNIEDLRAKLRQRVEELRRGKGPRRNGESGAGDKDELLEERRQQRAAMRERRRKETKEKKRREEEEKGRKTKGKERQAATGPSTKVFAHFFFLIFEN